ncbi:hypothetical protein ACPXCS_08095 [Streptomyces sp. DT190]|uniref:hypothetical protein n=1 Tax=unclassified Streptomyces TaxID=2593676 RepID=UPI003CF5BB22
MSYAEEEAEMARRSVEHQQFIDMGHDIAYGGQGSPGYEDSVSYDYNSLTPLQQRQKDLELEAALRAPRLIREAREERERLARKAEEELKREREARAREEATRPTAPLATPSPLKTVALWIVGILCVLVLLAVLS